LPNSTHHMDQHKLYRTIQILAETPFRTEDQLVSHVLESIVKSDQMAIPAGGSGSLKSPRHYRRFIRAGDMPRRQELPPEGAGLSALPAAVEKRNGRQQGNESVLADKGIKMFSRDGLGEKSNGRTSRCINTSSGYGDVREAGDDVCAQYHQHRAHIRAEEPEGRDESRLLRRPGQGA